MTEQKPKIVVELSKNIPKLRGNTDPRTKESGVSLDIWLEAISKNTEDLTSDAEKITFAKKNIDFESGDACEIITFSEEITTWEDFKNFLRSWLSPKKPNVYRDLFEFTHITWNKKEENFLRLARNILDSLKRVKENGITDPKKIELLYEIAQSTIIQSLPERTSKIAQDKFKTTKSAAEFTTFITKVNESLNEDPAYVNTRAKADGIYAVTTKKWKQENPNHGPHKPQEQPLRDTRPTYFERNTGPNRQNEDPSREERPTYYEKKYNKCGRCLKRGHFRFQCRNTPWCQICKTNQHEFITCPNKKPRNTPAESSFLGQRS